MKESQKLKNNKIWNTVLKMVMQKVPPQVFKLHSSPTIYNNCMLKTNKSNSSKIHIYNIVQIMGGSLLLLKDKKNETSSFITEHKHMQ